jgi:hypothetical protein
MSKSMQNMVDNATGSATPWIDVFTSEIGLELVLYNGELRVISDCHFSVQLNRFIPGFRSYSVAVFLK